MMISQGTEIDLSMGYYGWVQLTEDRPQLANAVKTEVAVASIVAINSYEGSWPHWKMVASTCYFYFNSPTF